MPRQLIISEAESVEKAINEGLARLGKKRDKVDIEILEEAQSDLFGKSAQDARVKMICQGINLEEMVRDLLKDILELFGLEKYNLNIDIDENYYRININTDDKLTDIIGPEGKTINALQSLIEGQLEQLGGENIEVIVNVGEYRQQRKRELEQQVKLIASQALEEDREIELKPMIQIERKLVHNVVNAFEGVKSHSIGEGQNRRVVILPRGKS